jgi:hypothetical protein
MTARRAAALLLSALLVTPLAACGSDDASPVPSSPVPSSSAPSEGATAASVLAEHGLDADDPVALVDDLDRTPVADRPEGLIVSVRTDELLVSSGAEEELPVALPDDRFYVSLAPYVDQTHECFYHSLTTCKGELGGEDVDVVITQDGESTPLVDETVTVFDNGFVGFWLPKDVAGTIAVTYGDLAGEVDFGTGPDDPTCITTLQLT